MKTYQDGSTLFMCGSGVEPCSVCGDFSVSLCDYPVGPRKTCDQPLCEKHSINQGAEWQDIHFCPTHVLIANGRINKSVEKRGKNESNTLTANAATDILRSVIGEE